MICVRCGAATRVYDSRPQTTGEVRRRRRCDSCGERFETVERPSGTTFSSSALLAAAPKRRARSGSEILKAHSRARRQIEEMQDCAAAEEFDYLPDA